MNEKAVKLKAKKKLSKIQSLLKKASEGKDTGEAGSELFIDDAADLVRYYRQVSSGNFKRAAIFQNYDMDTATRDLIDEDVYNFLEEKYSGNEYY